MTVSARRLRSVRIGSAAILASVLMLAPSVAAADPATDGFWYFDSFNIQKAHDEGYTGEGVTIVVVDTAINLEVPTLQDADIEVLDSTCYDKNDELLSPTSTDVKIAEHGTNVVSYLVGSGKGYPGQTGVKGIVPDAKVIFVSTGQLDSSGEILCERAFQDTSSAIAQGLEAAVDMDADLVSLSVTGSGGAALESLTTALAVGIPIIVAVGNEQFGDGTTGFPKIANGVAGVQSLDSNAQVQGGHTDVNTDVGGPGVQLVWQGDDSWEQQRYATGTSLATPIVAGMLALVAQKYPDATGNQLLQTLIHNTGVDDHELSFDAENRYGYGVASATHMLRVDPTQYEDVNPLLAEGDEFDPTREAVAAAAEALDNPAPPTPDPEGPTGSAVPWLPILIGVGVLLIVIVVVVIVVAAARRRTTPPQN